MVVNEYKKILLDSYYLDKDDVTVRRNYDSKIKKFKKGDKVVTVSTRQGYELVWVPTTSKKVVPLHQLITILRGIEIPEGFIIDHIDGNISNNSRENLRVTTRAKNNRNAKMRKDNKTGITGISRRKNGLYCIRKWVNGSRRCKHTRDFEEAKQILEQFRTEAISDGYTQRHGK